MSPLRWLREWRNRRMVRRALEYEYRTFGTISGFAPEVDVDEIKPGMKPPKVSAREAIDMLLANEGDRVFIDDGRLVEIMPLPRCDTCRWWDRGDAEIIGGKEWCWCGKQVNEALAITDCGEATIRTAPDFGCIQWEKKEGS